MHRAGVLDGEICPVAEPEVLFRLPPQRRLLRQNIGRILTRGRRIRSVRRIRNARSIRRFRPGSIRRSPMFRLHRRAAHPGQSIFAPRQRHGLVTSLSARLRCILTTVLCGGLASVCCRLAAIVHCRVATLRRLAIRRIALPGVDRDQLRQHDSRQHPGNPSSPDSSALHPDSVFPPDSALHLDPGFHLEPGFHPHSVFHRALSFSCRSFFQPA